MTFYQLLAETWRDTMEVSLPVFGPELALCATILILLLLKMFDAGVKSSGFYVAVLGALAALYFAAPWRYLAGGATIDTPIFTGMLMFDSFAVYMRGLLLFFLLLFISLTQISGVPAREEGTEFYVLIFGATLGMCLMVSANHMLIVFLAVEMVSVPSYVLAGLLKGRRRSSEAALKFAVFGAGTAGVMLYGISLLVGTLGSAHIPTMAARLADLIQTEAVDERTLVLILGGLMVAVGVSFKLSAVPFHFWAPDVFEGATAEVAAFLSIASKAAALGLLVRLTLGLGTASGVDAMTALEPARQYMSGLVALLAAVTCTFGNLAAYGQTNMKRLLAYSTIAHAGYMMMAVAAAVALAGHSPAGAQRAVAALAFYAGIYLFMNLGAFAVVAFLRNALGSEEIAEYAGLIRTSPGLVVSMGIILFSLVGLPPLAGFAAKFTVFAAMFDAGLLLLLAIGAINTVLSLFYYLRVIRVMALPSDNDAIPAAGIRLSSIPGAYCFLVMLPLVVFGVWWNGLFDWANAAAATLPY